MHRYETCPRVLCKPPRWRRRFFESARTVMKPALVLNADHRPLTYYPLSTLSWQHAVRAVFLDKVQVLHEYEITVRSPRLVMCLPSVVSLKTYIRRPQKPRFTRYNLFLRDNFSCQYCGAPSNSEPLTFDHLIPRRCGGRATWENVVAACMHCNLKKGGRTPQQAQMFPLKKPKRPTLRELHMASKKTHHQNLHKSWIDYVYWDSPLTP